MQFERMFIKNIRETLQKLTAAMGKSPHSGGLPFSLKRNLPAILLPARAAGIHTGFICHPTNEIF